MVIPETIEEQLAVLNLESFVDVESHGVIYEVAPFPIFPIGIGEAVDLAKRMGFSLPTPDLVRAIWEKADLKINAWRMIFSAAEGSNYTANTMAAQSTYNLTYRKLVKEIDGRAFNLIAGSHKDVVMFDGFIGIYGYQDSTGHPIQGFYTKHELAWKDYSQSLRLCRKKSQ